MCRSSTDECDLPEYCNGSSALCQNDVFKQDGHPCKQGQAYCYNGQCQHYDTQCQAIFGTSEYTAEHVSGAERWEFPLPAHVVVHSPRSTAQSYTRPLRSIPLPAHLQFHHAPVKSLHARSNLKFLCMTNTCRYQPKPYAWDTLSAWTGLSRLH